MFFNRESEYAGKSKDELKQRLQIINYEIATTNNKRQLKAFYKEIREIQRELRKIKEEENEQFVGRRSK